MNGTIKERILQSGIDSKGKRRQNLKVYDVQYRYKDPVTGRAKHTKKRGFKTKGEAEEFLLGINNQQNNNTFVVNKSITVREYLQQWLDDYAQVNLRKSSFVGYKRIIIKQIIPRLGNIELKALCSKHIDEFYAYLIKEGRADGKGGLSAKSVLYTHRVFKEALAHAVKKRLIHYNPMTSIINVPKPKKHKVEVYDTKEIKDLFEAVYDTWYEVPVVLAAICGMRRGEILGLKISDLDFDNNTIKISKQLISINGVAMLTQPKSDDSNRIISAPNQVFEIIKRHQLKQEYYKDLLGVEYKDSGFVTCKINGEPLNPSNFPANFKNMLKSKGLRQIRFHDLRHSCASLMLNSGVPMKVASQILGHSTITTYSRFIHSCFTRQ